MSTRKKKAEPVEKPASQDVAETGKTPEPVEPKPVPDFEPIFQDGPTVKTPFGQQPGLFFDVPDSIYHMLKLPSNSAIKQYIECPAYYELKYEKSGYSDELKSHFQQGKLFELILLEPARARTGIVEIKTKGYDTEEAKKVAAENPGKVLGNAQDIANAKRWAMIAEKKWYMPVDGAAQVSGICDLDVGGPEPVRVKFRADQIDFETRTIYDYKLMDLGRGKASEFERSIWEYGYDLQAAFYTRCMNQLFPAVDDEQPWRFVFRVQEKHFFGYDPRFTVEYRLDAGSIERAESDILIKLQLIQERSFEGYHDGTLSTERFKWGR
jgi:hypothetical protein